MPAASCLTPPLATVHARQEQRLATNSTSQGPRAASPHTSALQATQRSTRGAFFPAPHDLGSQNSTPITIQPQHTPRASLASHSPSCALALGPTTTQPRGRATDAPSPASPSCVPPARQHFIHTSSAHLWTSSLPAMTSTHARPHARDLTALHADTDAGPSSRARLLQH